MPFWQKLWLSVVTGWSMACELYDALNNTNWDLVTKAKYTLTREVEVE
jgi:hypothetical protein